MSSIPFVICIAKLSENKSPVAQRRSIVSLVYFLTSLFQSPMHTHTSIFFCSVLFFTIDWFIVVIIIVIFLNIKMNTILCVLLMMSHFHFDESRSFRVHWAVQGPGRLLFGCCWR